MWRPVVEPGRYRERSAFLRNVLSPEAWELGPIYQTAQRLILEESSSHKKIVFIVVIIIIIIHYTAFGLNSALLK